jgi:AAA+ ATPase superfamily predicted ATPase
MERKMKFYNRELEMKRIKDITQQAKKKSRMTILLGRRRIGKTRLIHETFKGEKFLYFFVSKTSDYLLSQEFLEEINSKLDIPIYTDVKSSKEIFLIIMNYAERNHITVVFDEFQNYQFVNPAVFSELQNLWDQKKDKTKCNLILMGSLSTMMDKIFKDQKEPLFGRADYQVSLSPFTLDITAKVLKDHDIYSDDSLTDYMIFTGGVPKYLELVVEIGKNNFFDFLDEILFKDSLIINEGKVSLIEEFGKNYSVYFAILQLVASGKSKRSELLASLPDIKELGGYLNNLMENFGLVKKIAPILAPGRSKNIKYQLDDYFYSYWFRFIYRNQSAVEAENFQYIKAKIRQEWPLHKGYQFEKIIKNHLKTLSCFNIIGSYWDRKGENEIDIAAVNDMDKILLLGECKLNPDKIDTWKLKKRSEIIVNHFKNYKVYYRGFYPGMLTRFLESPGAYLFS